MKQFIDIEQALELDDGQRTKIKEWWNPTLGEWFFYCKMPEPRCLLIDDDNFGTDVNEDETCLPLLSIGQMIEFLDEDNTGDEDGYINIRTQVIDNVCDVLWGSVKEKLNK